MFVGGKVSVSLVTAVTFPSECQRPSLRPAELWISPRVKDGGSRSMQTRTQGLTDGLQDGL